MTTIGDHRVTLCHVQNRGVATAQRKRPISNERCVTEAELRDMPYRISDASLEQQQADRYQIHRSNQGLSHSCRAVKASAVVNWSPDRLKLGRTNYDWRVQNNRCCSITMLKRCRINERFKGRPRLTIRLPRSVEFAGGVVEPTG